MRIFVSEFTSLDGAVQAPGGPDEDRDGGFVHGGWPMSYSDPDTMGSAIDEPFGKAEALMFGRRTWQVSATQWPERTGDRFADPSDALPKYVASRTMTEPGHGVEHHAAPAGRCARLDRRAP